MLNYLTTNILQSTAQTVVNPINTAGYMDKGLAWQWRQRFPAMYADYLDYCRRGIIRLGKLWLWKGRGTRWVLCFPTQDKPYSRARLYDIQMGLFHFADTFDVLNIQHVAFPQLGCGRGRLDWEEVQPWFEYYLEPLPIQIDIHLHEF